MGVIAEERSFKFAALQLGAYGAVVALAIYHHEAWADEAQSWLLARDSSLLQLWITRLHYEGTPGLWQTFLHVLTLFRLPYAFVNILSGLLGCASAWVLIRRSPFPAAIRVLLPFTFFLCYQYAVIARSYSLLPLLLFASATLYPSAVKHPFRLTIPLALLAAVSVHGLVLSASIAGGFAWRLVGTWKSLTPADRRNILRAGAAYAVIVILVAMSAWPASDGTFITRPYYSLSHFLEVANKMVREAFTGETISSWAVLVLSIPLLWRGQSLLAFAVSGFLLCAIAAVIYSQVWHQGILFLAWLFALWMAAQRTQPGRPAMAAMLLVITVQCYWTYQSIRYDWRFPYSGSREAAMFLSARNIPPAGLYAIGYACTGIQPYFARNIFGNFGEGAFWDWSRRNHVNQDAAHLDSLRPKFVIVGYKGSYEQALWTSQVKDAGYSRIAHFEGNLFWKTRILEPESYDLYQRLDGR
jgi:hypothetical protein